MVEKGKMLNIAGIQIKPEIGNKEANLHRCLKIIQKVAERGARLIVFPECVLTGYCFSSLQEAIPLAETIPGPSTNEIAKLCHDLQVYVVIGMLEMDGQKYYNAAALLGPEGLVGKYRKLHLPYLGIDRFLNHGDNPLVVYETPLGTIGMGICYDGNFPEHSRILALLGADIMLLPTNWPEGSEFNPEHMVPTRAKENRMFLVAVNRVGEERGFKFFGRSKIVDCLGFTVADGKPDEEDFIFAEIDPARARKKHTVRRPGEYEVDYINDRRPDCYQPIVNLSAGRSRIR